MERNLGFLRCFLLEIFRDSRIQSKEKDLCLRLGSELGIDRGEVLGLWEEIRRLVPKDDQETNLQSIKDYLGEIDLHPQLNQELKSYLFRASDPSELDNLNKSRSPASPEDPPAIESESISADSKFKSPAQGNGGLSQVETHSQELALTQDQEVDLDQNLKSTLALPTIPDEFPVEQENWAKKLPEEVQSNSDAPVIKQRFRVVSANTFRDKQIALDGQALDARYRRLNWRHRIALLVQQRVLLGFVLMAALLFAMLSLGLHNYPKEWSLFFEETFQTQAQVTKLEWMGPFAQRWEISYKFEFRGKWYKGVSSMPRYAFKDTATVPVEFLVDNASLSRFVGGTFFPIAPAIPFYLGLFLFLGFFQSRKLLDYKRKVKLLQEGAVKLAKRGRYYSEDGAQNFILSLLKPIRARFAPRRIVEFELLENQKNVAYPTLTPNESVNEPYKLVIHERGNPAYGMTYSEIETMFPITEKKNWGEVTMRNDFELARHVVLFFFAWWLFLGGWLLMLELFFYGSQYIFWLAYTGG